MSDYKYTDDSGDTLRFTGIDYGVLVESDPYISIPNADVPTVVLELLKAAGQESVIVPKAYEEVTTKGFGDLECGSGPEASYGHINDNPNWLYNRAANYVALAQWIEGKAAREAAEKAEAEAAEKKLQERRDAVKAELVRSILNSTGPTDLTRAAINRIIELEDGAPRD